MKTLHIESKSWNRVVVLVLALLPVLVNVASAQGPGTLLYDRFGVSLELLAPHDGGKYYSFDWESMVPTRNVATVDWVESDWYGNWSHKNWSYTTIQHPPAPGTPDLDYYPSGGEWYDVEAIYLDNDVDNIYVAIITSVPHYTDHDEGDTGVGIFEIRYNPDAWFRPGDISVNLFKGDPRVERSGAEWYYNYGLDIVHEDRYQRDRHSVMMRDNDLGASLYKTAYDLTASKNKINPVDSDWYVSAHGGYTESHWEHTNFDPFSTNSQAEYQGEAITAYYEYEFPSGELENGAPTYIIEATIPRSLFGADNPGNGDSIGIRFTPGCRNDGNSLKGVITVIADVENGIGDRVWYDTDRDGIQDAGETGVEDVTVYLYDSADQLLGSTDTGVDGYYGFGDLPDGEYYVKFDISTIPAGYVVSDKDQGGDDDVDSDADTETGLCASTILSGGEVDLTWDMGIFEPEDCVDLDFMTNFNAIVFGDLNATGGDSEYRLAVGGTATFNVGYSVGYAIVGNPIAEYLDGTMDMLIVAGDLYDGVWSVNGNVVYGGTRYGPERVMTGSNSLRNVSPVTLNEDGNVPDDGSGKTFAELLAEFKIASAELADLDERGVMVKDVDASDYQLRFEGGDDLLNVFNVSASDWSCSSCDITISAPAGSTVLLNIRGASVNLSNGSILLDGVTRERVLFNYADATEITSSGIDHLGSVLAPYADATLSGGAVEGVAILGGDVVTDTGFEFHYLGWGGDFCVEPLPPQPTPTVIPPQPTPAPTPTPSEPGDNWSPSQADQSVLPGIAAPQTPAGVVDGTKRPVFEWEPDSHAIWFWLWIEKDGSHYYNIWVQDTEWQSEWDFDSGSYTWYVRTWNNAGYGAWSEGVSFEIPVRTPAAATLLGPSGSFSSGEPTFEWTEIADATWYQVWVEKAGASGWVWANIWTQDTSWTPATAGWFDSGSYTWYVQTWNEDGYGDWSEALTFEVPSQTPEAAVPLAPAGTIFAGEPEFSWDAVNGATWYKVYIQKHGDDGWVWDNIWVQDTRWVPWSTGWFTDGSFSWWIQTWNNYGYGEWSEEQTFTVQP